MRFKSESPGRAIRDIARDRQRSFRLAQLEPLAALSGVRLFSIQKGPGVDQIGELGGRFEVLDLGSRFGDFMETAAVMRNLDLVITSDSSLAHLAGALGVPIWVAIPFAADWRWFDEREQNVGIPRCGYSVRRHGERGTKCSSG